MSDGTPIIPPAFKEQSDGCTSVPDHHYREACYGHDWRYRGEDNEQRGPDHRKEADDELRDSMRWANLEWLRSQLTKASTIKEAHADLAEYVLRWSWRPWLWWAALRLCGWFLYYDVADLWWVQRIARPVARFIMKRIA